MLGYVAIIAVIMFGWQAWTALTKPPPKSDGKPADLTQIDFDVEDDARAALKDDEIRITPRRSRRAAAEAEEEDEAAHEPGEDLVNIPADWLSAVEDNTVGIRQDEASAFYRVLAEAQTAPLKELRAQAVTEALFVNLMTSPAKFRGRPVTIVGEMRKLRLITPPKNDYGFTRLYEAWICTPESGENPYRVVCSEIPADLKPQESCRIDVKTTGYFFKREGYETQDHRLHVAPTVLAGRLFLSISPHVPPPAEDVAPWMIAVLTVIGLAMLATVIGYAVGDARVRRQRRTDPLNRLEVDAMARASESRISIEESLRRLEEIPLQEESDSAGVHRNGHAANGEPADAEELIDLPTPFPPTRVPRRWG